MLSPSPCNIMSKRREPVCAAGMNSVWSTIRDWRDWERVVLRPLATPPKGGGEQPSDHKRQASRFGNKADPGAVVIEIGCDIGMVAGGIEVVGTDGVEDVVVKIQAEVIAQFVAAAKTDTAGGPGADFDLRQEGKTTVDTDGSPELDAIVRRTVAGVIPSDCDVSGDGIEGDFGEELAVGSGIGVDANGETPGDAVIVREAHEDIEVIGGSGGRVSINHVKPAAMRTAGVVVRQAYLGVHGAAGLRRDGAQAADSSRNGARSEGKTAGSAAGGIYRHLDGGRSTAATGRLIGHGNTAIGANGDVPEVAGAGAGNGERRAEGSDGAEARDGGSPGNQARAG